MIHPSYVELMKVVNNTTEVGEEPVVNSRYSIVIAAAKRARQLIAGDEALVSAANENKPLSTAVQEIYEGKVKILGEDEDADKITAPTGMLDSLDISALSDDTEESEFEEDAEA